MFLHKITLPDGTALDSSVIRSVALTEQVNDNTDLCPGAACAACAAFWPIRCRPSTPIP